MADFFAKETIKSLRKLRQLKPDYFKGFMDWDEMIFKDGALPAKTKELMAVTAAHVTACPWCIEDHVKRAIKKGRDRRGNCRGGVRCDGAAARARRLLTPRSRWR